MATFGPLPGPRKSRPRALFTAWTRGPRSHERIIRIISIVRFIKIIGLICIIRIISTISQYLISSGPARRPLRAPDRQGPKHRYFIIGHNKIWLLLDYYPGYGNRGQEHFWRFHGRRSKKFGHFRSTAWGWKSGLICFIRIIKNVMHSIISSSPTRSRLRTAGREGVGKVCSTIGCQ